MSRGSRNSIPRDQVRWETVSYTHLDVYKRQAATLVSASGRRRRGAAGEGESGESENERQSPRQARSRAGLEVVMCGHQCWSSIKLRPSRRALRQRRRYLADICLGNHNPHVRPPRVNAPVRNEQVTESSHGLRDARST